MHIVWNLIKMLHLNEDSTNILTWTSCSQAGGCIVQEVFHIGWFSVFNNKTKLAHYFGLKLAHTVICCQKPQT